jgi:phage-related protein
MFNRTQFNLTAFNRPTYNYHFVSALLEGIGSVYPRSVIEAAGVILMQGIGTLTFTISTDGAAFLSGVGSVSVDSLKELYGTALFEGVGDVFISGEKYQVKQITFTGDFEVGDTIKIDMDKFTVTLNGTNAMNNITGDFFDLLEGENTIVYEDGSTSRTVYITVEYRDRWI